MTRSVFRGITPENQSNLNPCYLIKVIFSGLKHASELNAVQVHSGGQVPGREGQREGTRTREKSIPLIYQPTRRIKYLHLNPTSFRQGEAHAG